MTPKPENTMDDKLKDVSLETLAGGAVPERFDLAWADLLENVLDPNTDPKEVREVVIKVKVKPQEDREGAAVRVEVLKKLAAPRAVVTPIHIGHRDGQPVAVGYNPKTLDLFGQQDPDVKPIRPGGEKQA